MTFYELLSFCFNMDGINYEQQQNEKIDEINKDYNN
jgi:hypothetical protein